MNNYIFIYIYSWFFIITIPLYIELISIYIILNRIIEESNESDFKIYLFKYIY